jgi:sugar/nucleoside kinase (ribokinase family)
MSEVKLTGKYDIVFIGHIDKTVIDNMGNVSRLTGGGSYFAVFAAQQSGVKPCLLTKLAPEDQELLGPVKDAGIDAVAIASPKTTSVLNIFETADLDRRKVQLLSQADPFCREDLPDLETKVYSLAGLFAGEIPDSLITELAVKARVALDLQSVLRANDQGKFVWRDWDAKREFLPYITYLKADLLEAEVITGSSDREKAAWLLTEWGAREVMITHSTEAIVCDGQKIYRAPFTPRNLSGRTGRGDTAFSSYLAWRFEHDAAESLRYSAALTSLKMEQPGPFTGTVAAVLDRIKSDH